MQTPRPISRQKADKDNRITYRNKLPQLDASLPENGRSLRIHAVPMRINHLDNTNLANLDAASQARACIAVQHGTVADALPARLEQGVLLCVNAQAGGKPDARAIAAVASRAAAVGTVLQSARSAVVSCADDPLPRTDEHAAYATLHAV